MSDPTGAPCECTACKGAEIITPVALANSPGLNTLAWRVGTHGQFKESMLTSIGRQPALARLTTRADDDSTIALMDAWAASLDVLAFYQERYANENYLRTATERRSVLELARMIGYELRPGVAASTTLAYTLQNTPGSPAGVQIAAGSQAMTTPGQDETPQTFETSAALDARVAWNAFAPASWATRAPKAGDTSIRLSGAAVGINPGDMILIVGGERLSDPGSSMVAIRRAITVTAVPATPPTPATQTNPSAPGNPAYTDIVLNKPLDADTPQLNPQFYVLHQTASLWGAAALDWNSLPPTTQQAYEGQEDLTGPIYEWPNFSICGVSERAPEGSSFPICDNTGFYGEYYTGNFATRYGAVREAKIDFGPGKPFGIHLLPPFSVRWSARFVLPNDGTFYFTVTANGHTKLIVDGQIFLDQDNGGTASVPNLKAYRKHSIVLEYSTSVGTPSVTLAVAATGFEAGDHGTINLDRTLTAVSVGQWLVMTAKQDAFVYQVTDVADDGISAFAIMGHSTRLALSGKGLVDRFDTAIRSASVFAVSERIDFGQYPITAPLSGATLALAASAPDLPAGRTLIVAGSDPLSGAVQSEIVTVKSVGAGGATIELTKKLANQYAVSGTTIYGNCVAATHGATIPRPEVMGAGDGSRRFQCFTLKQKPLTYVSAANAAGVSTTLDVKVNDISWSEVPSLYAQAPSARVFITRRADDGTVRVMFGNGVTGARLPTGVENVVADYRTGIGVVGMAKANQINIALTRPLGVSTVTNPAAPTGAQDPEVLAGARVNAPLTVLTLDRVVSVSDYADLARGFAGMSKAVASLVWSGERRIVFVTVASADGSALPPDAAAYKNLVAAIDDLAPSDHHFQVADYIARPFKMNAAILPVAGLDFDVAAARVRDAMTASFSFAARDLGTALSVSEVVAAMQNVDGVAAARLDQFTFVTPDPDNTRPDRLLPGVTQLQNGTILPAGLILLAPGGVELVEMAP